MGNINQNKFQTQKIDNVADETVAEQLDAENIANQLHNKTMNKREWSNEEKL